MTVSARNRSAKAKASRLDRRRERLQARRLEADVASKKLAKYAEALESNSTRVSQLEADVATTRDRLAVLKKSLKDARKQRDKIRAGRKKIRQNAAVAAQRATLAERKYDQAMLADMLEREKQQDLSRHGGDTAPTAVKSTTPSTPTSATRAPVSKPSVSEPTVSMPTVSEPVAAEPTVREPVEPELHQASGALAPSPPTTATRAAATATRTPRRASTTASRTTSARSSAQTRGTQG